MCTQVLTKARAFESIKCCVSLKKERFAFALRRLTRRIVMSNQDGGPKRAPSVCNVHLLVTETVTPYDPDRRCAGPAQISNDGDLYAVPRVMTIADLRQVKIMSIT